MRYGAAPDFRGGVSRCSFLGDCDLKDPDEERERLAQIRKCPRLVSRWPIKEGVVVAPGSSGLDCNGPLRVGATIRTGIHRMQ